ncbi:MAG: hypothetical protein AAGG02_02145 [Cyanobacteria bacterium P01_H01_bin.15]
MSQSRDLFAQEALAQIPKILTLCDRNRHSPNYGCFDRTYWQYKVVDFPSGMSQEFVFPLALAYHTNIEGNRFYQEPLLRDWVAAGILFAAQSSHADGSCDDYFPFERAGGAAAFSLLACLESFELMELDDPAMLKFFARRGDWLAHHQESGRLSNHQALIVLCLQRLGEILGSDRWERAQVERLEQVLSWQHEEGWFQEYEGCDPGYQTLTISCLSQICDREPTSELKMALTKAARLAAEFVHPDGSFGGEYTSRNTYNFFPYGFEIVGRWLPEALNVNDRFLKGLAQGLAPCYADDRIIGHHTWNYLLAWRDFARERPPLKTHLEGRTWYQAGGIIVDRRAGTELYLALNKGGVFKLFREGKLLVSDTHLSLQVESGGHIRNAVGHLVGGYEVQVEDDLITIRGHLGWAKQKQMTPLNLMILRVVMLTVGRFFPNLIRRVLQKVLITGKNQAPYRFERRLRWEAGQWHISDELTPEDSWQGVVNAGIGCDQTSIYVVMSRTYQAGQLQLWLDLTADLSSQGSQHPLRLERTF